jgi:hypothetical protein
MRLSRSTNRSISSRLQRFAPLMHLHATREERPTIYPYNRLINSTSDLDWQSTGKLRSDHLARHSPGYRCSENSQVAELLAMGPHSVTGSMRVCAGWVVV